MNTQRTTRPPTDRSRAGRATRQGPALALLLALVAALAPTGAATAEPRAACTGDPSAIRDGVPTQHPRGHERHDGRSKLDTELAHDVHHAVPVTAPQVLVLAAPGLGHTAASWDHHLTAIAEDLGAVAAAVTYPGLVIAGTHANGLPRSSGWPVRAGAQALIDTAGAFLEACPTVERVVLFGVSMGANVSGYALTSRPTMPDGQPLFDTWLAVEGVHNVLETYVEAYVPKREYADAIAAEAGGHLSEVGPAPYLEMTNVARVADIVASGITRSVVVHAVGDGLVPYDQSRELAVAFDDAGHPYEFHSVLRRGTGEDGTAPDDHVKDVHDVENPLAGHASEPSTTHIVMRVALERLAAIVAGATACGEYVADEGRQVDDDPTRVEDAFDVPLTLAVSATRPC